MNWEGILLGLDKTVEIRKKLESISDSYNTEDGQIRWLQDNGYNDISLDVFYSVAPRDLKIKMSNWSSMRGNFKLTVEIRKKIVKISESYNTEDGQIRWLQDNGYDIHPSAFYTIIPKQIKEKMTQW